MKSDDYLLEILIEMGLVTSPRPTIESLRQKTERDDIGIIDFFVEKSVITKTDVARAKACHFGVEFVRLRGLKIGKNVLETLSSARAHLLRVIPISLDDSGKTLRIAIEDPSDLDAVDTLNFLLKGKKLKIVVASGDDIDWALDKYYADGYILAQKLRAEIASIKGE